MPYYTISYDADQKSGENVGNSYNKYLIQDLLREQPGYDGVVCTDWNITHDIGPTEEAAMARMRRSAFRLLLNIFHIGLFENPYLDLEASEQTVGCPEFVEKGYRSQLRSITMLKNRKSTLPLRKRMKLYVPDRFIRPYLNFMSMPNPEQTITPPGKALLGQSFTLVDTPEEADGAVVYLESPISIGCSPEDRKAGGNGYVPISLQYRPFQAVNARQLSLTGGDPLEDGRERSYRGK